MRIIIIVFIATLLSVGASGTGYNPVPMMAPEDCDHSLGAPLVNSQFQNSELVYQEQLCAAATTGIVTYTEWADGVTPVSRAATLNEIAFWDEHVSMAEIAAAMIAAETALAADIEGVKWVKKLREWELNAQNYYAQWPTLTDTEKGGVMREMLRRQGLTWGGLADLLTVLEKGR